MIRTKENLSQPASEMKSGEDRYLKMLEEIQDYAIIVLDRNGIIQHWNIGAEKIKGYKPSEIIGKSFKVFYRQEDLDQKLPDRLLKQAAEEGRATHEGWRVKKDGSLFWSNVTLTALHNEKNEVTGFLKITKDLTEQKIANDKLQQYTEELSKRNEQLIRSEERYHQMIDEVEDYAIILLDTNGHILHWNKGAQRIKGYTAAEAIGQSFTIFYAEEDKMKGLP